MYRPLLLLVYILNAVFVYGQTTFDTLIPLRSEVIYFDFGKHDLRPGSQNTLLQTATFCRDQTAYLIYLTAHTDAVGTDANNDALSQRRAEAAFTALVELGVTDSLINIKTFGEKEPVADNDTDEGRQLNRRVTIEVFQPRQLFYLAGKVIDEETQKGIQADIVLLGNGFKDTLSTDSLGYFRQIVPEKGIFELNVYSDCYFFKTQKVKVGTDSKIEVRLTPAVEGAIADIGNLYFVGNQAVLLPKSEPELPKVLRFMQQKCKLKVEIAGHINLPNTPPVAKDTWHWKLSVDRAKLVYDYLIENGIDSSQVSYQGYGNTQMRFPNARLEAKQALNRRVEIRILKRE